MHISYKYGQHINLYSQEGRETRVNWLKDILDWVESECEVRHSYHQLNLLVSYFSTHPQYEHNEHFEFLIQIMSLLSETPTYYLSEDTFLFTLKGWIPISIEYFLKHSQPSIYGQELLPYLLDKQYLGLTISLPTLMSLFNRGLEIEKNHRFWAAIKNLSYLSSPQNIWVVVDFIKDIYLSSQYKLVFRSMISKKILRMVLPSYKEHLKGLRFVILSKFTLAGNLIDQITQDLDEVLKEI